MTKIEIKHLWLLTVEFQELMFNFKRETDPERAAECFTKVVDFIKNNYNEK